MAQPFKPGLLNLGIVGPWGYRILHCASCSMHCKKISSTQGLHTPNVLLSPPSVVTGRKTFTQGCLFRKLFEGYTLALIQSGPTTTIQQNLDNKIQQSLSPSQSNLTFFTFCNLFSVSSSYFSTSFSSPLPPSFLPVFLFFPFLFLILPLLLLDFQLDSFHLNRFVRKVKFLTFSSNDDYN